MYRSLWFWVVIALILGGIALTAALGVLDWLVAAFAVAILILLVVFLVAAFAVGRAEPPEIPPLQKASFSKRVPVVYDCDIAMGRPFRDPGAGLALLYLLGEPRVHLRFITTTYGNGSIEVTTRIARRLLDRLGCSNVAVLPGVAGPGEKPEQNQAAQRLVDAVNEQPGEIALIATGNLTNLRHAAILDPDFFDKLRAIYLFGGLIGPLVWNGHPLAERNFSLDPEAAYEVVQADCPVTIAAGQAGLTAVFRGPQFAILQTLDDPVSQLVVRKVRLWFALMRLWFRDDGFGMWDSIPALMLVRPDLFESEQAYVASTREDMHTGQLFVDLDDRGPVRLVHGVRDLDGFIMAHLTAWRHLGQRMDARGKTIA